MEDLEVDLAGDFFGDYEDYSPEEFGLAPAEDEHEEILTHNGDSDDNEDVNNEGVDDEAAYETSLEPNQPPNGPALTTSNFNDAEEDRSVVTQPANWLWGGADVELNNKPYIVKFSKGKAGAVYTNHGIDGNASYISQIGNPESPRPQFHEWRPTRIPEG